jgi:hypothetical protein
VPDEARAVLPGGVAAVADPRAVEGLALAQGARVGRYLGVQARRVVTAALVRLVRVLHLEDEAVARASFDAAAEAMGSIMVLEAVRAHARVLVLAESAAVCVADVALVHRPQAERLE